MTKNKYDSPNQDELTYLIHGHTFQRRQQQTKNERDECLIERRSDTL